MSQPYLIICSSPRTGSTLLVDLLLGAGLCTGGLEYFEHHLIMPREVLPALGIASLDEVRADVPAYVERIKRHWARPRKPLCLKVHWRHLVEWRRHGLDLESQFPGARYLFCTRSNLVAQTISMTRAIQTGGWTSRERQGASEQYGFWRLMYELNGLVGDNQGWEAWFRERRLTPYRLRYEDFDADYRGEAARLLDWLGAKLGPFARRRLRPRLSKQRDQLSREWEDRFYSDLARWHASWEQLPLEERHRILAQEKPIATAVETES